MQVEERGWKKSRRKMILTYLFNTKLNRYVRKMEVIELWIHEEVC